jgi:hypothetical protein
VHADSPYPRCCPEKRRRRCWSAMGALFGRMQGARRAPRDQKPIQPETVP